MTSANETDAYPVDRALGDERKPRAQRSVLPIRCELAQDRISEIVFRRMCVDDDQGPGRDVDLPVEYEVTQQRAREPEAGRAHVQTQLAGLHIMNHEEVVICYRHSGHTSNRECRNRDGTELSAACRPGRRTWSQDPPT